jgi:signal transduction histidine kinase
LQHATNVTQTLLALLSHVTDVHANLVDDLPADVRSVIGQFSSEPGSTLNLEAQGGRYLVSMAERAAASVALGPYRLPDDSPSNDDLPVLDRAAEQRAAEALRLAATGVAQAFDGDRQRLELATRLEVVSRAALAVTGELELNTVLRRLVDLARELSGARYAALGVPGPSGELESFLTSGMSAEEEARIGERPRGLGVLGLLLREPRTIRLADLNTHPSAVGFPSEHPPMRSFLGVPIISRGRVLGNLYLTEKRTASEFSDEDARVVELLARHAGVAIENARLYATVDAQQSRLQLLVDQMPEAVLIAEVDPERITLANPQASALLGWDIRPPLPLSDFLACNARSRSDGIPLPPDQVPLVRSLRDGAVQQRVELAMRRPDGSNITVLVNSVPLTSDDGHVNGSLAVFQDITLIKDAEQLKDDFLSLVAHELRTPLTTIRGGAVMLQRDWAKLDVDTQAGLLADISTESRRLSTLIENMVQLANIRAGRLRVHTEPLRIAAAIGDAVAAVRQLAGDREFRVTTEPRLLANADPAAIDQVLRNLVHNAVKYAPGDSPVDIDAQRAGDYLHVAVRDYGPGIDEDAVQFIFERFRRSQQAVDSGAPGMGLGLYLARHLIEAQGGRIWVERPNGGGARVVFSVPALDGDDE